MLKNFRPFLAMVLLLPGCDADLTLESTSGNGTSSSDFYVSCLTLPPALDSCGSPLPPVVEVGPATRIEVTFSRPVDPGSIVGVWEILALPGGERVSGASRLEANETLLVFEPTELIPGVIYSIGVESTVMPRDNDGRGVTLELEGEPLGGVTLSVDIVTFADPPTPVEDLRGEAISASAILLSWNAAVDSATPPGNLAYRIYRNASPSTIDFRQTPRVTQPGVLKHIVDGLESDTEHLFTVTAVDHLGNEGRPGGFVVVRTQDTGDDSRPPDFAGVTAVERTAVDDPRSATALVVRWDPATDNVDPPELLRYNVYLALLSSGQDFGQPCEVMAPASCLTSPAGATEMLVTELDPDTTYFLVVRAVDSSRNESPTLFELSGTTRVSFAANITEILTQTNPLLGGGCNRAGCHSGLVPSGGLDLTTYQDLMTGGTRTRTDPDLFPIVVPFEGISDDMQSYLIRRIEARTPEDEPRMPLGSPEPLNADLLERLKRWIHQGALDN